MKILHQLGHNSKWAIDSCFENGIGDGFIFNAYSFDYVTIDKKIVTLSKKGIHCEFMIDLQFYGNRDSEGGKLDTYPFHPINLNRSNTTQISGIESVDSAIDYQKGLGFNNIIIPHFYYEEDDIDYQIDIINRINKRVSKKKEKQSGSFYMTIPLSFPSITNAKHVERILQTLTDMDIAFDGYYIVCDANPEFKKKISVNYTYYYHLIKIFRILQKQKFKIIYGYANWDALIFCTLCDIDYLTIGTYENLRNFNIKRFTEDSGGGPSKGWYFSELLLNFVKAQELDNLRFSNCLNLIANKDNIFSDIILKDGYPWNTHKPDVHKNYLLAVSRLLSKICNQKSLKSRIEILQKKVIEAKALYRRLEEDYKVYLNDESSDYHLGTWDAILRKFHTS